MHLHVHVHLRLRPPLSLSNFYIWIEHFVFLFLCRPYVFCDNCLGWFHTACVGITYGEARKLPEFLCPQCATTNSKQLPTVPYRTVYVYVCMYVCVCVYVCMYMY